MHLSDLMAVECVIIDLIILVISLLHTKHKKLDFILSIAIHKCSLEIDTQPSFGRFLEGKFNL
jgi:hypothetical protein